MNDDSEASGPTLTQTQPTAATFPPDPSESALATLYRQRPQSVRLGMIESVDGKCAGADGSSRSLNGPEDLRLLRTLRSQADVVVVGAQTARRERYGAITLPEAMRSSRLSAGLDSPVHLAIVTRSGNLPPELDPTSTWVVTTAGSPATHRLGAEWQPRLILSGADNVAPRTMINELALRGLTRVLCEGGPTLAQDLLKRGLVDDYCLTTSPQPGGAQVAQTPPVPPEFHLSHELVGGGFIVRRWRR
ncbi:dihydrofolate reductase family protein [Demequina aurantiaca]|uniref:dihydrofolate reductase family protein n=1 Tax=Demequina aurantiaca TaxID=676200 RepID=UPI000780E059|nr:dihydrofolate reductase family protein [Demequina aurantiaca]